MSNLPLKRIIYVALILVVLTGAASAQVANTLRTPTPSGSLGEDSLVIAPPPKRADIAALEALGLNLLVWGFGRYVLDGYWTEISVSTMDINLRHGFEWDPNMFKNNFSSHPYHGNTYFNTARTNGMNFWESVPYAFTASLTWELFMESEFPSYGDLIMTSVAGTALGEELYRFSEQLLDDRTGGWGRFWRELGAAALNPVGGFNRLIRGDMFRKHGAVNHIRNPLTGYVAWGTRTHVQGTNVAKQQINPAFSWTLQYGDPYEYKPSRKPYDYFTFRGWLSSGDSLKNVTMLQQGVIAGKNFTGGANDQISHLFALMQHYDYVNVDLFNYGGVTFAPALISSWPLGSKGWRLNTQAHLGWLMLGGSNNEYFTNTQGRNYNYTWGFKAKAVLGLRSPKFGAVLADFMYFWMDSLEGIEGTDKISQLIVDYNKRIYKNFGLGLEYFLYARTGDYTGFPVSEVTVDGARLLITYAFY